MTLDEVQDMLSSAVQADLEHGVKWLNARAATEFDRAYPAISSAVTHIMRVDADEIHSCSHLCMRPACVATREAVASERQRIVNILQAAMHGPLQPLFESLIEKINE